MKTTTTTREYDTDGHMVKETVIYPTTTTGAAVDVQHLDPAKLAQIKATLSK